jgi:S-disulfanyl-L-cysteine oxidoreductase SoxD
MPARSKPRAVALAATVAVVAALAAYGVWRARGAVEPAYRLRPDDAALTAAGQRRYMAQCASCHGTALEGQPNWRERGPDGRLPAPPHDVSGHTWHHPDELLFRITKHGVAKAAGIGGYVSAMPAYEGVLSDQEIVAVLSWIKSQWPGAIRSRHDELNRSAERETR